MPLFAPETPVVGKRLRTLDFDLENRPLSYWYSDRPTAEVTAIAAAWTDDPFHIKVWLLPLGDDGSAKKAMLAGFVELFNQADQVTGHYIRKHDLPHLQAELAEFGMDPLKGPKLTEDTKLDLIGWGDQPKTQEHLGEMMGLSAPKVHMTQTMWRESNRLTPEGLKFTEERVVGDVRQHMELRVKLREAGLLKAPKLWNP